jgi:ABC-type transporter Mla subunit MlaD
MKKPEYLIATSVIVAAVLFTAVLAFSIGKLRYTAGKKLLYVKVESAAGILPNTQVKFGGAPIGRVDSIRVLPRSEQEQGVHGVYCIELTTLVDSNIEIGDDVRVSVRTDGMLGSNYIALMPVTKDSPLLADGAHLKAIHTSDINDLTNSGQELIVRMLPVVQNLQGVTRLLNETLPTLTDNLNDVMTQTDSLLKDAATPENRERIQHLIQNLDVVSANLKVVTTNAKALTSTLAQKPWRLIWGGPTNPIPPESEVLKSNKPIPIKNVIEVKPADSKN